MRSGQCMELVTGGSDMWIFIVFVCVTVTAIIIFVNYRRTKKTMDTIEEMLNVAVKFLTYSILLKLIIRCQLHLSTL